LETSGEAYLPVTLSLISLYTRSLYHQFFGPKDDGLKTLSLFSSSKSAPPSSATNSASSSDNGKSQTKERSWSIGKVWREIRRRWGIEVDEPNTPQIQQQQPSSTGGGGGGGGREAELEDTQRALEGNEEWIRGGARERDRLEEDEGDEFLWPDDEGELSGTLAIVVLCAGLA
jgi:SEL1 protein